LRLNDKNYMVKIVKTLYYQLLIGCGIHGIFWYLFNLIFISLFIVIIIFMFKKNCIYILFLICLMIVILNYFNFINLKFSEYNRHPVHHSIKPLSNTFIYATTGFYLASLDILNKISVYRIKLLLFLFLFLLYIKNFNLIIYKFPFLYNILIDIVGICLILFFSLLPFDKIENFFIKTFFIHITYFTGGIYYLHPEVKLIFKNGFISIYHGTFKGCILIYIISYFICFIGSKIFSKNSLKFLFI
jgi:hypothetical protein